MNRMKVVHFDQSNLRKSTSYMYNNETFIDEQEFNPETITYKVDISVALRSLLSKDW